MKTVNVHTATLEFERREQFRDVYKEDPAKAHWTESIMVKVPHGVTRGALNPRNWPTGRKIKVVIEVTGR